VSKDGKLRVSVTVTNKGTLPGKDVVQLYVSDLYRSVSPPVKELKGFRKVHLAPGQSDVVEFVLTPPDLSFIDREYKRKTENGKFRVAIGNLTGEFELR
jgi:beta-glucosidase